METVLTGAAGSTIVEMGKCLFLPLKRQFDYVFHYKRIVENFKNKVETLGDLKNHLEMLVATARMRGELVMVRVELWLGRATYFEGNARTLFDQLNQTSEDGCFKEWQSRYRIGKDVTRKIVVVDQLINDGKFSPKIIEGNFSTVSYIVPPPSMELLPAADFIAFPSTESAMEEIMKALLDENISMVGVYGMGGIGKTTLVKQLGKRVKRDKLFHEVVMVTVSRNLELEKLQGELAEKLGLALQEQSISVRASRLSERVKQEKTFLMILDDLWERVELDKVGIPYGKDHKGLKILLTSRSANVCRAMESQAVIKVEVLSHEDSWMLFREKAGDVDYTDLQNVARQVAKECGGLPIAIVTVGRALRDQDQLVWNDALLQLKRSIPTHIEGMHERVFPSLKLSYDSLPGREIKLFFLFCCIFPENHNVSVKLLIRYAFGDIFLDDSATLEEIRYRVNNLVRTLKASCLLSNGDKGRWVKIHDVIRDVGISIASTDVHGFLVKAGMGETEWPTAKRLEECSRISFMSSDINWLPDRPNCPRLSTLLMQNNWYLKEIPVHFFHSMQNLHVLDLSNTHISSLPPSLVFLRSLQTLCLDMCIHLTDVSLVGKLQNLRVLSLRSSGIREFRLDLSRLKLLDLSNTIYLKKVHEHFVTPFYLEELYMVNSFSGWEFGALRIIRHYSIRRLYIHIDNVEFLSREFLVPGKIGAKLKEFRITVGSPAYFDKTYQTNMQITTSKPISTWVKELIQRTENLSLFSCHLDHMWNLRGIVGDSLLIFENLRKLRVAICLGFEDLFSVTLAAQGLRQLEILEIVNCHGMKQIVALAEGKEQVMDKKGLLPKLRSLSIENVPYLTSFCQDGVLLDCPSLLSITVKLCPRLKRLPLGLQSAPKLETIEGEKAWFQGLEWEDVGVVSRLQILYKERKSTQLHNPSKASTSSAGYL
ncbi:disease resistance protein At4g27190-like [Tasmannia lanceolata]|uniref:disease resistance protein At4g27190-like n=1 Tax=Tasmannia lanceolata TaxID=3420 RepID=UPI004064B536